MTAQHRSIRNQLSWKCKWDDVLRTDNQESETCPGKAEHLNSSGWSICHERAE